MKTSNANSIVLDITGPDDEDHDLRALTTVDIDEDDTPRYQAVDEFSNEFLLQAPRGSHGSDPGFSIASLSPACRRQQHRGQTL